MECASLRAPSHRIRWRLIRVMRHDRSSFTEGLVFAGDRLFESSGPDRRVFAIDPSTGRVLSVARWSDANGEDNFAEGLAFDGRRLVQLSWHGGRARTWDPETLMRGPSLTYEGAGWGLCFDGRDFLRSDGSATLTVHDRDTFASLASLAVTIDGEPLASLNELECIGTSVFANVWYTAHVVRIDRGSGEVTGVLDLSELVRTENMLGYENVLNGLAWDPNARQLYVTGKRWKHIYVIELFESPS
jgi:glutamine cyclotransferase